jgi:hypothetical protein
VGSPASTAALWGSAGSRPTAITIPLWSSLVAFVFTGGLAILLWRESRRRS